MRRPTVVCVLVAAAVAATACSDIERLFTEPSRGPLGRVTSDYVVGEFAWTPDNARIAYVSNGKASRGYEVAPDGGTPRAVTAAIPGANGTNREVRIGTLRDAYYVGVVQDRWCDPATIYQRFSDGHLDTVATDVVESDFAASPSGNRVAFNAVAYPVGQELCPEFGDSLVVLDVAGPTRGTRRVVERNLGSSEALPVALGDDGSLVYIGNDRNDPRRPAVLRYATPGAAPRELWRTPSDTAIDEAVGLDVSWIDGALHLIIARTQRAIRTAMLEDLDVATGRRTTIATINDVVGVLSVSRSTDGRAWAAWTEVENKGPCVMERVCLVMDLLLKPAGATAPQRIEHAEGDNYPGRMKFSPDGHWLSFMFGSGLYTRRVD